MTNTLCHVIAVACLCSGVGLTLPRESAAQLTFEPTAGQPGKDVVWVPTPREIVEKMLDMADVTPRDVVMDLGSGDGRNVIAAGRRGARALGVEYNPDLVALSRQLAREAGVADRVTFIQGDMYEADISQASVLVLFLKPENLDRMRDKLLAMKPGSRIVLNTFPVPDWDPDATETFGPPCKTWCTAMLVVVPAQVAGVWRMGDAELNLTQDFQIVRGMMGTQAVVGRLRGNHITLTVGAAEFAGELVGDRLEGRARVGGADVPWSAVRVQTR